MQFPICSGSCFGAWVGEYLLHDGYGMSPGELSLALKECCHGMIDFRVFIVLIRGSKPPQSIRQLFRIQYAACTERQPADGPPLLLVWATGIMLAKDAVLVCPVVVH
jgi:hypothetical protein